MCFVLSIREKLSQFLRRKGEKGKGTEGSEESTSKHPDENVKAKVTFELISGLAVYYHLLKNGSLYNAIPGV